MWVLQLRLRRRLPDDREIVREIFDKIQSSSKYPRGLKEPVPRPTARPCRGFEKIKKKPIRAEP